MVPVGKGVRKEESKSKVTETLAYIPCDICCRNAVIQVLNNKKTKLATSSEHKGKRNIDCKVHPIVCRLLIHDCFADLCLLYLQNDLSTAQPAIASLVQKIMHLFRSTLQRLVNSQMQTCIFENVGLQ